MIQRFLLLMSMITILLLPYMAMGSPIDSSITSSLTDAELAYQSGRYSDAQSVYASLLTQYPNHGKLWYNIGNTYLKQDQLGRAIAAYRQSAQFTGYDDDLRFNLALARGRVVDQVEVTKSILNVIQTQTRTLSISTLFWISNLTLILLLLTIVGLKQSFRVELMRNLSTILLVFTLLFWTIFALTYSAQVLTNYGVVIAQKAAVKSGPSETLPTLFYVHDGLELTQLDDSGDWVEVQLDNGLKGWLPQANLIAI